MLVVVVELTFANWIPPLAYSVWTLRPAAMRVLSLTWSSEAVSIDVTLRVLYRYPPSVKRVTKTDPYS